MCIKSFVTHFKVLMNIKFLSAQLLNTLFLHLLLNWTIIVELDQNKDVSQKHIGFTYAAYISMQSSYFEGLLFSFQEKCDAICKTRLMSQNAKLSFWSHFKAKSELFPELFKFCPYDIHIQSYN